MADYIPIIASETDPEAPLRSSLFKRLEANPRAIAEGAPGAPRVQPQAMKMQLARIKLTDTTPVTITGVTPDNLVDIHAFLSSNSNAFLQVRFSNDGGSAFGGWINLGSASSGAPFQATIPCNLATGERYDGQTGGNPASLTSFFPVNAIGFRLSYSSGSPVATVILYARGLAA